MADENSTDPTSCTQIFATSSLPIPIQPHRTPSFCHSFIRQLLKCLETYRSAPGYSPVSPRGGMENFTTSQHTKIARRRKSTAAKVASELAEYFAAEYRNCRSPIALSQFLAFKRDEEKSSSKRHFGNIEIRNPCTTSNSKDGQTSKKSMSL